MLGDDGLEARRNIAFAALDAQRFADTTVVARKAAELVKINRLADGKAAFQLLQLAAQGGAGTDQTQLKFGQRRRSRLSATACAA